VSPAPLARAHDVADQLLEKNAAIWFDRTWDNQPPSAARAVEELGGPGADHAALVSAMIHEHHRIRRARHDDPLVEAFRRADLADVTGGLVRCRTRSAATTGHWRRSTRRGASGRCW
jgi:hypothetical protein